MEPFRILMFALLLVCNGNGESRKKVIDMTRIFLKRIEDGYNKDIMPLNPNGGPVPIGFTVYLRNVELDDKAMQMNLDMTFRMHWKDPRLSFTDSPEVDNLRFLDYTKIWTPDPFFTNAEVTEIHTSIHPEAYIRVNSSGNVLFSTRLKVKFDCLLDLSRFPHDTQECDVRFASYGYTTADLIFNMEEFKIPISSYMVTKSRFDFVKIYDSLCGQSQTNTGSYSCYSFTIVMKRISSPYICEWYLPCACLVIIAFFSHMVSAENLIVRVVLTLGPLLTIIGSSILYRGNLLGTAYSTALDVFTGISVTMIFLTLLHVVIFFFYSSREIYPVNDEEKAHEKPEEEEEATKSQSKKQRCKDFLKRKGDVISRVAIIGFYIMFIFFYIMAYSW